jgi:hypothetical protein
MATVAEHLTSLPACFSMSPRSRGCRMGCTLSTSDTTSTCTPHNTTRCGDNSVQDSMLDTMHCVAQHNWHMLLCCQCTALHNIMEYQS